MKKILFTLLCFIGLSGCGYLVQNVILDPINESIHERIEVVYSLNKHKAQSNFIYEHFELREDKFSEFLLFLKNKNHNIRDTIIKNGGDCKQDTCYFYFIKDIESITKNLDNSKEYSYSIEFYVDRINLTDLSITRGSIASCDQVIRHSDYSCFIDNKNLFFKIEPVLFSSKYKIRYMPYGNSHRIQWNGNFNNIKMFKKLTEFLKGY